MQGLRVSTRLDFEFDVVSLPNTKKEKFLFYYTSFLRSLFNLFNSLVLIDKRVLWSGVTA
jgi:hypothetical protein